MPRYHHLMNDTEAVLALEETWGVAPLTGDLETLSAIVADDWVGVGPTGRTMTKQDLLEMLVLRPGFDSVTYDEVELSLFGDTGIVTSAFYGVGKEIELKQRYMRVYAKRGGRWCCVATQIVPTPAEAFNTALSHVRAQQQSSS